MNGYDTAGAVSVLVPDLFINLIGGEYPSGVFHEQFQDVVFTGCQGNRFSVHGNGLGIIVQIMPPMTRWEAFLAIPPKEV